MADTNRIPEADNEFNDYINQTADYLQITPSGAPMVNWERLLLTASENNQWKAFRNDWNTKFGTVKTNKANGIRNTNDTKAKNDAKDDFTAFVLDKNKNLLNRIGSGPNVTDNDRTVFRIKLRDDTPTARPKITTAPFVDFKVDSGAIVIVTCRVEHDSDRASMHPDADEIEMRYILLPTDAPAPAGPEDAPNTETSTKAIFRFEVGVANAGKRMWGFLRWKNASEKGKSGPWNQVDNIVISN